MRTIAFTTGILLLSWLVLGCQENASRNPIPDKKPPRPVETQILELGPPPSSALVSASVAAWKTEQIGFEVSGRITAVKEPKTPIEGHVVEVEKREVINNDVVPPVTSIEYVRRITNQGTVVAEIESEQYELQFKIAQAKVDRANQDIKTANDELTGLIVQKKAAEDELAFATHEFARIENLEGAVSASEFDRARADKSAAEGRVADFEAQIGAKNSNILSLNQEVLQAKQSLLDAGRNLENCDLYSSFPGEVAGISVVPGSYVTAGSPVATVQMMNPIKIELEVSADESRKLRKRIEVPIWISPPNGGPLERVPGFLYLIDPVADSLTRTFTVTLLVLNEKTSVWSAENKHLPVTDRPRWVDLPFIPGAKRGVTEQGDILDYVDEEAIHFDDKGPFLWRITKMEKHQPLPEGNKLAVTKMHVSEGPSRLPFLGNWWFQQVIIPKEEGFDPEKNVVAGKLFFHPDFSGDWDGDTWNGEEILVDRESKWGGTWMLRPGDTVKVDLSNAEAGFYVPMDALVYEAGRTYLFVIDEYEISGENGTGVARRTEVKIVNEDEESTSSMRRIEPVDEMSLDGLRYVTRGVQYLRDGDGEGEPVRIVLADGAVE